MRLRLPAWIYAALICAPAQAGSWRLSEQCPPSFEKRDSRCFLHSNYQQYASLTGAGVGGLKTGLPPLRDGFTPQQIDLGRYLFFDPVLSANGRLACVSCHVPSQGFSDHRVHSIGIDGRAVRRNAPSLWNAGFLKRFFWDGRAHSLEEQAQGPLYNAAEMGNRPEALLKTLNGIPAYRELFAQAFPAAGSAARAPIAAAQVYQALAAFEASLISLNSRYDFYAQGVADALTPHELEGLNIFRSFVARCAECHTPPLFTNQQIAVIGMPEPRGQPFDPGAGPPSGEPLLRGGFKVPSLRNAALTAPYGHGGQFATLRETVAFYTGGRGHAVPAGEHLQLHWHIWEPRLSPTELDRLVDFIGALTDQSFLPTPPAALPSGLPLPPESKRDGESS
ncbi:MAG: cytochrome-c peroxidase [Proteobacteria bacterium]|nr:cytochrome-c peroxidase [Pseudomonadota bacterium]